MEPEDRQNRTTEGSDRNACRQIQLAEVRVVIMADNVAKTDGFVRSGNFVRKPDVCPKTGAADLPTAKFFACEVGGVPMHVHIMEGDEVAQALCSVTDNPEQTLEALKGLVGESDNGDLRGLEQVHFPVGSGYHLLTPLKGSVMFALTDILVRRGVIMRKKEDYKEFAKRSETCGLSVPGMWAFHYGSTKPQNVSLLNQDYGGDVLMLPSFPPAVEKRTARVPKHDFISECLYPGMFEKEFDKLNKAILIRHNNKATRELPLNVVKRIALRVSEVIEETRNVIAGLDYEPDTDMPEWQNDMLACGDGWTGDFAHALAVWIHNVYAKKFNVMLGDDAIDRFEDAIAEIMEEVE